ncbi:hypothetical protein INT48_008565 [Thamnidium elegans]|uniref:Uncharacterized protein n=1 Tax=Thamnidium elegans TaxID=101142 RepID=A0A8H7W234_9FUNG|nr:hypothetical protein INT48_008565 [Thamnidium elegans]
MAFICQETEEEAEITVEQKEKPKLFSFIPNPSLKWRNININNKLLATNAGIKTLRNSYSESLEMFDQVFDLKRSGNKSPKWGPSKFVDSTLVPLVVFDDGMKHKDTNIAATVDINEFRTSITRNVCKSKEKMKPLKLPNGINVNGILVEEDQIRPIDRSP